MEIWAHRGDRAHAPENTLPAFARAIEAGADGVELDARLTADGEIIVLHDPRVDRVTGVRGAAGRMSLEEIRALEVSGRFSGLRGAKIPTLREVYELIRPTSLSVNVELKSSAHGDSPLEEKCAALAREMGMAQRIVYSSFEPRSLARLLAIEPSARAALLCRGNLDAAIRRAKEMGLCAIHPHFPMLYEGGAMEKCAKAGLIVRPWTVNDREDMEILRALGVHGLITDRIGPALRLRDAPRNL